DPGQPKPPRRCGRTRFCGTHCTLGYLPAGRMMVPNINDLSLQECEARLVWLQQPACRARQIWQWLFHERATAFAEMTNLSASLRGQLDEEFSISRPQIVCKEESLDGTEKFLFGLADGESIESVRMRETTRLSSVSS